ncbi:MAG TPA: hypothetical protein PLM71_05545 [Syntrophorhabdaceae bacterium]|nr:hypothetical protein [Syntrophorhabdaceae bacterium]
MQKNETDEKSIKKSKKTEMVKETQQLNKSIDIFDLSRKLGIGEIKKGTTAEALKDLLQNDCNKFPIYTIKRKLL